MHFRDRTNLFYNDLAVLQGNFNLLSADSFLFFHVDVGSAQDQRLLSVDPEAIKRFVVDKYNVRFSVIHRRKISQIAREINARKDQDKLDT